jgi:hypothetical protein
MPQRRYLFQQGIAAICACGLPLVSFKVGKKIHGSMVNADVVGECKLDIFLM